jgi:hypothetical protein
VALGQVEHAGCVEAARPSASWIATASGEASAAASSALASSGTDASMSAGSPR